jgi:glycerol-3-phosphate acyltransferase PlsY
MYPIDYILIPLCAYLIGSIPFGLLITKFSGLGDIRTIGSGNIGATNVLRTGNKALALLTLVLDSGKGAVAVIALTAAFPQAPALFIGLFAIAGHCFPVWLKFKGGKGVSTALGVLLAATPITGLATAAVWIVSLISTRISSLSALTATALAPLFTFFIYGGTAALYVLAIALLIAYRHKDNILRLLKGEEPKVGKKKNEPSAS